MTGRKIHDRLPVVPYMSKYRILKRASQKRSSKDLCGDAIYATNIQANYIFHKEKQSYNYNSKRLDKVSHPYFTIWNSEETTSFKWTFLLILLLIFFPGKSHLIYLNLTPNLHREDLRISLNQQEENFKDKYNVAS